MKGHVATVLASAARTASGSSSADPVSTLGGMPMPEGKARFFLDVSAVAGTGPTLVAKVFGNVGGKAFELAAFAQATAVGKQSVVVDCCPEDCWVEWTIGGTTPSFTFDVQSLRF